MTYEANLLAIQNRSQELAHYGIRGQKWGLRRFQNEDGSLTEAGKDHYGKKNAKYDQKIKNVFARERKLDIKENKLQAKVLRGIAKNDTNKAKLVDEKTEINKRMSGVDSKIAKIESLKETGKYDEKARMKNLELQEQKDSLHRQDLAKDRKMQKLDASTMKLSAYNNSKQAWIKDQRNRNSMKISKISKKQEKLSTILYKDQIEKYKKEHPNTTMTDKQIMANLM